MTYCTVTENGCHVTGMIVFCLCYDPFDVCVSVLWIKGTALLLFVTAH